MTQTSVACFSAKISVMLATNGLGHLQVQVFVCGRQARVPIGTYLICHSIV